MPRALRSGLANLCYHVINRGNAGTTTFATGDDYAAFTALLAEGSGRESPSVRMRIAAWCAMPDHFHLVLWPRADGDLSRWMQWLMTAQVRSHHKRNGTSGHLWHGRFKSFPVQKNDHLLAVVRYVERNPVRKGLAETPAAWPWSSLGETNGGPPRRAPVDIPKDWPAIVAAGDDDAHALAAIRTSVNRGAPYGKPKWIAKTARRLGLESTLNPIGRPRKAAT